MSSGGIGISENILLRLLTVTFLATKLMNMREKKFRTGTECSRNGRRTFFPNAENNMFACRRGRTVMSVQICSICKFCVPVGCQGWE